MKILGPVDGVQYNAKLNYFRIISEKPVFRGIVMKHTQRTLGRRQWLELLLASGASLGSGIKSLGQTSARITPNTVLGPFYPIKRSLDQDADLTRIRGLSGIATGEVIDLSGRVMTADGKPVRNARIDIWQANHFGRYGHASDPNTKAQLDPYFQGYATQHTDIQGRFRFKTIKPGPYPSETGEYMRSPHIHFDVMGRTDRKVTQLYFRDDPLLQQDRVFQTVLRNRDLLFGSEKRLTNGSGAITITWDIVLRSG